MLAKSTEYAIRALVYIQLQRCKNRRPGVIEVAREIETPRPFTAKILQTLAKHKLVNSSKGRGGGFFFTNDQDDISLYEVIMVMEGNSIFYKCGFGLKNCNNSNPCPLHDKYKVVRDGFLEIVKTETIQSLSKKIKEGKAVIKRIDEK